MDEDVILREIVKSLAFEIEAVNQDNVLKWSTTNGTPLNVKVRVRNKDEPRLVQRGTMPVPIIAVSAPEKLALVSSNQTILSFSLYLQDEFEKKEEHKRQSGFKLFNIGSCLGTYSDDEGPYLPSSSNQNDVESNISITSSSGILQKKVAQVLSTSNAVPRNKKRFFGKCKPGGCLDPPFGEDNYPYGLSKTERHENIGLEPNELEDNKKTCIPGGCLDPSFSEEKYPYSVPKTDHQKKLGQKLDKTTYSFESPEKTMERSGEPKTSVQKITKDEGDPKKLTDICTTGTSEKNSLKLKYSNSIITYPTDKHSTEKVYDQIPYKKMSDKSNDEESLRQSYEYPESYFVPPKDVTRYKEEERRHGRRLSMDQLSRSSKVAAKSSFFKSISQESKYLQHTKVSKDSVNDIDLTPKVTKHETATLAQSSGFKEDSSIVHHNSRNVVVSIASETSPVEKDLNNFKLQPTIIATTDITKSNTNKTENFQDDIDAVESLVRQQILSNRRTSQEAMSEISPKITNMEEIENLDDGINLPKMPVREGKPSTRGTSRETITKSSQSHQSKKAPITRILNNENARNQEGVEFEKQPIPALDRFVNTDIQTSTNLNQQFKNNDVKIYDKKTEGAFILATAATIAVTEKEYLLSKDNQNVMTESLMKDKYIASLSNREGHPQGGNESPNDISSTENCDFDISSSHSIDFKQERLSSGNTNGLLDTSRQEDEWLSPASNNIRQKNDLRNVKLNSEPEEKKTSAILKKRPFKTKQDSDIRNDDINKATPLKRNTFTIIGSDASLQKSEEMPDNITDVQLKTTDKTNVFNNLNKKSETKIHTNSATGTTQTIKQDSSKDMYSEITGTTKPISDEQTRIKEESLDKDTKHTGNISITDSDKNFKTKNVSDPTTYQTDILDTMPKNIIYNDSLLKQLLMNEKPHSNIAEDDESTLNVQSPSKAELLDANVQAEYTKSKDIYTSHLQISDEKKIPKITIDHKPVLDDPLSDKIELSGEYDRLGPDLLQTSTPAYEQKPYPTVYDDKNEFSTQNEKLDFASIESKECTTYDSGNPIIEMLQKPTTKIEKGVFSKTADDGNLVSIDPTSKEVDRLDTNFQELKYKMYNTSNTGSIHKRIPENAIDLHSVTKLENLQNSRAQFVDHNKDVSPDLLCDTNAFLDTGNNEPTQKFIPEHIRDLHSGMPRKINDQAEFKDQIYIEQDSAKYRKSSADVLLTPEYAQGLHSGITVQNNDKAKAKNLIYNEMARKKYSDSAKDDLLKTQLENVQDFLAPTVYDNAYDSSDRIYENMADLDTQSIEPTQKIKPEHVRDSHSAIADQSYDKTDIDDQIYNELSSIKYSEIAKDDLFEIRSENFQELHSHTARRIKNISSDQIYDKTEFLNTENNESTQKNVPVRSQDLQSAYKPELNDQIYNDQDKVIDNEQTTEGPPIHTQTADENEYISPDQKYDKRTLLDPNSNKPQDEIENTDVYSSKFHEQMALAQNLTDNIHGLREKSKSASISNSPFSGYSGLISEVLSHISENIEGEEKQSTGIKVAERISSKLEDLAIPDTNSYRDQEMLDSEFANIVEETGLIKLSHVKDDGSYNVPQNSLDKSFTSTLEENNRNIHTKTIAQTQFKGDSSDGLRQRSDDYPNNTLNTARDDVLLDNTIDISKQNSEYQSPKILASINDSIGLNENGFPLTLEQPTFAKQKDRTSIERGAETTYLDMSFYSYMNNNNQRVVETHSPLNAQHRRHDGTVTVVKTLISHGNEIRIPVDKENDISLNILKKEVGISNNGGVIGSPLIQTRREKHVDLAKRHDDVINKNLSLIYEHELIPLHNVIKNLAQEVNTLSAQQERLQMRIRNTKRTKSLRLIPVGKRCGCRKM